MTVQTAQQAQALCQAILLGGLLGMVYDGMRVLRCRVPLRWLGGVLDFAFWLGATAALFLWSHEAWGGQIRWYGPLFCLVGGGVYFWGLSRYVLWLGYRLADVGKLIWKILTLPVRLAIRAGKRLQKFWKTSFHSRKNGI